MIRSRLARRPGIYRGTATVELAVVLPLLLTLIFGIIQLGWYMFVRHIMHDAARNAARKAAMRETQAGQLEEAEAELRSTLALVVDNVDDHFTYEIRPAALDSAPPSDPDKDRVTITLQSLPDRGPSLIRLAFVPTLPTVRIRYIVFDEGEAPTAGP